MATYHGIEWAACLTCGYNTTDTTTLEMWNDGSGECPACAAELTVWRCTDGSVAITNSGADYPGLDVFRAEGLVPNMPPLLTDEEAAAAHSIEAECLRCRLTFIPHDRYDTIHAIDDNGDECGGIGVITGTYSITKNTRG